MTTAMTTTAAATTIHTHTTRATTTTATTTEQEMPVRSHGIDTFSCLHPRPQRSTIPLALLHLSLMSLRLRRLRSSPLSTLPYSPHVPYWGRKLLFSVIMCNKRRSVTVAAATAASSPFCSYSCIRRKENVVVNVAVAVAIAVM